MVPFQFFYPKFRELFVVVDSSPENVFACSLFLKIQALIAGAGPGRGSKGEKKLQTIVLKNNLLLQ